jgi:hypothetical protein
MARQQSAPVKSLTKNYVTGFLWVRAVAIAMQRLDKQIFNNKATVFRGVRPEVLSWRQLERPKQMREEYPGYRINTIPVNHTDDKPLNYPYKY